jgi:hypothetical protein
MPIATFFARSYQRLLPCLRSNARFMVHWCARSVLLLSTAVHEIKKDCLPLFFIEAIPLSVTVSIGKS